MPALCAKKPLAAQINRYQGRVLPRQDACIMLYVEQGRDGRAVEHIAWGVLC